MSIKLKIHLIVPITGLDEDAIEQRLSFLRSISRIGTEVSYTQVREGPPAIECQVDHDLAAAEVLKCIRKAEDGGFDAVIIWCAGDPGLAAARSMVDIPVIGPGDSMRMLTSTLGKNVIGIDAPMPVLELRKDLNKTFKLVESKIRALTDEGYDAFYLNCLGMFGMGAPLRKIIGLPIVDPAEASLKIAEVMVELGFRPSRITYPKYPPIHRRKAQ